MTLDLSRIVIIPDNAFTPAQMRIYLQDTDAPAVVIGIEPKRCLELAKDLIAAALIQAEAETQKIAKISERKIEPANTTKYRP